ncbi:hypothetical protein SAMN06269185_0828 [Natronoarchaeum philippinense]|uniref:Uncharacterized protein n=1 Tax=Natronoarchaeum philippinense TaxID=558529 RepID=A0A285N765_NATPI|nr:DR2241 family protein [Natronoarchaeum philippinense]SNZ05324.1 hypothetical protein SAMN06269185_0828 [Natronoarchaeum philippinense]
MNDAQFDALLDALDADGAVAYDGVRVEDREDGYALQTPDQHREALDESQLRDAAADADAWLTNWYYWERVIDARDEAREEFLHWLERADEHPVDERYDALADGIERTWGELAIHVTVDDDGLRRYRVTHVDDAEAEHDDLDGYHDPLEARELFKTDDDGRYRPLRTAPTLPTGWAFVDLDGHDLVRTIDFTYPATIQNWHREREGELDVTHWHETAERQTGIYDVLDELDADAVDWIAEACCDDSQCLRRREWQFDEDHELTADGGSGTFPCREPCSLVVAAGRKWTTLEDETERTYQLDLTLSELRQIEELIDAVADGRTDEIREADVYDGANRYRARYLRAKRFDEDGELSVTEIGADE